MALRKVWSGFHQNTIPILMYHGISDPKKERKHPYYCTETSPERFRQHMEFLRSRGFTALNLDNWLQIKKDIYSESEDNRKVIITFDDGFLSVFDHAAHILENCGFTATMFLATEFIGDEHLLFKGKPCMNWSDVRQLKAKGMTIGSHTVSHRRLDQLNNKDLMSELKKSKEMIECKLGAHVKTFSYPYAFAETDRLFRERLLLGLFSARYRVAVTTMIGTASRNDNSLCLKRLPINGYDDLDLFEAKLFCAYDWMHGVQIGWKRLAMMFQ